jgi:ribonuclease E
VEDRLRDAVKHDRARIQIGRLSRFGLLEMSRQRLRPSLGESSHLPCPRCNGVGNIRSVESMALAILRLAGEDARKDRTARLVIHVPVNVATYLMNEKRGALRGIEEKCGVDVILVPNPNIETPEYEIRRVRGDEAGAPENTLTSYKMPAAAEPPDVTALQPKRPPAPMAEVATIMPAEPAPSAPEAPPPPPPAPPPRLGFFRWLKLALFGDGAPAKPSEQEKPARGARGAERHPRETHGRGRPDRGRPDRGRPDRGRGDRDRGDRDASRPQSKDRDRPRPQEERRPRPEGEAGREQRPRRDQAAQSPRPEMAPPRQESRPEGAAPVAAPFNGAGPPGAPAAEGGGAGRSRRGGRRRRGGRGGRGGEGGGLPMTETDGGEGTAAPDGFRLQHSDGPVEPNSAPREWAPESRYEPAPPQVMAPPPPPPEARPSVVWSSSASAADSSPRSEREE